jgi:cell division protease FtsH
VRDLFKEAQKQAPCIIFIDEIDAIGKSRDSRYGGGNDEREQTLNQLLAEMDGFDSSKGLFILAATNRPEVLDKALLRPGRFDRRIIVDKPDLKGRIDTLKVHSKDVLMDDTVDLEAIGLATSGAVGSDLANMINEAAIAAVKDGRKVVSQKDLFEAVEVVIAGKEKKDDLVNTFAGDCAEMEGASIAHAAYVNNIPCLIIRAISDKADGSAEMDYPTFEKKAAANSIKILKQLIKNL